VRGGVNWVVGRVEAEQIYVDGLNVAARLESRAETGGIYILGTVSEQVGDKLELGYEDCGEQVVKNIARPVRVWRVLLNDATPIGGEMRRSRRRYWRSTALLGAGMAVIAATFVLVQHLSLRPQETHASIPARN